MGNYTTAQVLRTLKYGPPDLPSNPELEQKIVLLRKRDSRNFLEGDEHCRAYFDDKKVIFGTSKLAPGKRGDVDPGHPNSYEVFYVAKGTVICRFEKSKLFMELEEEDAVLIPPGEPHQLINVSEKEALVVWSQFPVQK